jgi:hypothetical protein
VAHVTFVMVGMSYLTTSQLPLPTLRDYPHEIPIGDLLKNTMALTDFYQRSAPPGLRILKRFCCNLLAPPQDPMAHETSRNILKGLDLSICQSNGCCALTRASLYFRPALGEFPRFQRPQPFMSFFSMSSSILSLAAHIQRCPS